LIDGYKPRRGEAAVAFVDNALMLAWGKTLLDANSKLSDMLEWLGGGIECSHMHHCHFVMDKLGIIGLTRRREMNQESRPPIRPAQRHPIILQGTETRAPVEKTCELNTAEGDQVYCTVPEAS